MNSFFTDEVKERVEEELKNIQQVSHGLQLQSLWIIHTAAVS